MCNWAIDYGKIGARIRERRKSMGLTQEKLAEKAGISFAFVGHIERGTRKLSVATLAALARALDCSADYLLGIPRADPQDYLLALHRVADFINDEIRDASRQK